MNILFVFPLNEPYDIIIRADETAWSSKLNTYKNIKKLDCAYPTGLLSIASYLKKQVPSVNIRILDLNAVMNMVAARKNQAGEGFEDYSFEDLLRESMGCVAGFDPDVIGISVLFCSNYKDLGSLAAFLKQTCLRSIITCGGHLPSSIYERIYNDELAIDAVAFGEGEVPFTGLVKALQAGKVGEYLAACDSWITRSKLIADSAFRPVNLLLQDLDEIPPYDFDMLVFPEVYFNSTRYFFVIESMEEKKEIFMFTTRGCPYLCVFCASQTVHGNKIRSYSVARIKSDIDYYNGKYNITRFVFYDDHFLINRKRAVEILNYVTERKLAAEIPTPAFFSVNEEVATAMERVGIKEVNITIESGNENTLKQIMKKPSSLAKADETVEILHRHGITVVSNILIGLPGETEESIEVGMQYLLKTNINWFQCFVAAPLPGSELYRICSDNNYFVNDYDISSMDYKRCLIKTKDFSPEFIEKKVYEMNLTLNFMNNYDYRTGNHAAALKMFERIIETVIDTHAFAYYFAAKCCKKLNLQEKYEKYKNKYIEMVDKYPFWAEWALFFKLEPFG